MNKLWWACLLYPPESHRELGVCPNGLKRGKRGETKMAAVLSIASCSFWGDNAMVAFWESLRWVERKYLVEWFCVERKSALTKSQRWVSSFFRWFWKGLNWRFSRFLFEFVGQVYLTILFTWKKGCFDWSISGSSFLLFAVSPSGYETKSFVHRVRLDWHEFISGGKVWNST